MIFDPSGLIQAISDGLSTLPSALIAAALLAGPTAIWLIARLTNPPAPTLKLDAEAPVLDVRWVCWTCRSINDDGFDACYRCHRPRSAEGEILVDVGAASASEVGIAVGPGLPEGREGLAYAARGAGAAGAARPWEFAPEPEPVPEPEPEAEPAVDPDDLDEPDVLVPAVVEPRVRSSRRRSSPMPAAPVKRRPRPKAEDPAAPKPTPKPRRKPKSPPA